MEKRNPYLEEYDRQRQLMAIEVKRGARPGAGQAPKRPEAAGRAQRTAYARARRKRIVRRQRITVAVWTVCLILAAAVFLTRNHSAEAAGQENVRAVGESAPAAQNDRAGSRIQGLPQEVFEAHPQWTEDFLTPNEYSRPGDALEQVKDVFVHYTANPGTSAAQNRSYFEQQKDVHERSVSAHFIIGCEGEIIQCVPLDEIAYAVMTRNMDSVSIECCYRAEDGSFTQETYDSLVELLAWLTDAYGLDTEHILRHYDCGGKKCPLYYVEHEDAWEQLLRDVAAL